MYYDIAPLSHKESNKYLLNYFILTGNIGGIKGLKYFRLAIAANTIHKAIEIALKQEPNFVIYNISHQGSIQHIEGL